MNKNKEFMDDEKKEFVNKKKKNIMKMIEFRF